MMGWFKPVPIYVRIYKDRMVLRRIDTGKEVDRMASAPFTSSRCLIGHFPEASALLNTAMLEINDRAGSLSRRTQMVVHPMEMTEDGLSAVETRAMMDLGEHSGSKPVMVVSDKEVLDDARVLRVLKGSSS